jgi:hypothetical protein
MYFTTYLAVRGTYLIVQYNMSVPSLEQLCVNNIVEKMLDQHREGFVQMRKLDVDDYVWPSSDAILNFDKCPLAYESGQKLGGYPFAMDIIKAMYEIGGKTHRYFYYQVRRWFMMGVYRAGHIDTIREYTLSSPEEIDARMAEHLKTWQKENVKREQFIISKKHNPSTCENWVLEAGRYGHINILQLYKTFPVSVHVWVPWKDIFNEAFARSDFGVCSWIHCNVDNNITVNFDIVSKSLMSGNTDAFRSFAYIYPDLHYVNIEFQATDEVDSMKKLSPHDLQAAIKRRLPILKLLWQYTNREHLREGKWVTEDALKPENYDQDFFHFKVPIEQTGKTVVELEEMLIN